MRSNSVSSRVKLIPGDFVITLTYTASPGWTRITSSFRFACPLKMSPGTSWYWIRISAFLSFRAVIVKIHPCKWFNESLIQHNLLTFSTTQNKWNAIPTLTVDLTNRCSKGRRGGPRWNTFIIKIPVYRISFTVGISNILAQHSLIKFQRLHTL